MTRRTPGAAVTLVALLGALGLPPLAAPASAAAGDVLTLGANPYGQLGNGAVGSDARPGAVKVLDGAVDVAAGREHTLALVGGRVWAWGADLKGAVGNGVDASGVAFASAVTQPVQLTSTVSGVDSVATGHYHSLALDADTDRVWAWGWNSRGQLGPNGGAKLKMAAPLTVPLPPGQVGMIAAGRAHSLALVDGQVFAWGDNGSGQLGQTRDDLRHPTPTLVRGLPAGVTWVAGGRDSSFAIAGGELWAWGNNAYGQLGNGSLTSTPTPVRVLTGVLQVESGADHTVALLADGTVQAWGRNRYGQVGNGSSATRTTPTSVAGLAGIREVRVGRDHSMAFGNGSFYAWGRNDGGQLGLSGGTRNRPELVGPLGGARDAGGGQVHTVALQ